MKSGKSRYLVYSTYRPDRLVPVESKQPRHRLPKKLTLIVILLLIIGCGAYFVFGPHPATAPNIGQTSAIDYKPKLPVPVGQPQRLMIASVGIDAPMGPVDYPAGGGELIPPFGVAAWYSAGPKPGYPGPAVIVGHVDSTKGPNVFWNLHKVKVGDLVKVNYKKQVLTFQVTKTATAPQNKLPTAKIWNKTNQQVLRLITCIGDFNYSTRHYSDNFIVYAKEVADSPAA